MTQVIDAIFRALAWILSFSYSVLPSYGFAIIVLTTAVMVITVPFTIKSTRSMLATQRLQPEIKRLQQLHKDDRQALNQAMMEFYKEHNFNPFSSCLPMLLPMPLFFIMYRVIAGMSKHKAGVAAPKYIPKGSKMFADITSRHAGGKLASLGMDLAKSASEATKISLVHAIPFLILVALVVFTGYYQAKQMTARNPQAAAANPQMQTMNKVFPLLFGFISFTVPAGVGLYFLWSNVFRIAQQDLMYRFDPELKKEVKREVKEVEAKASELKKRDSQAKPKALPKKLDKKPDQGKPAGATPKRNGSGSGRVTPKAASKDNSKRTRRGR